MTDLQATATVQSQARSIRRPAIECPEGVYRPDSDSFLLIDSFLDAHPHDEMRVLDLCAGSGVVGIAAAMHGHTVTAIDLDPRAVRHVRRNALLNSVAASARCGDLFDAIEDEEFDAIVANPPYVPSPAGFDRLPPTWADGGTDGRAVIDRICGQARKHLAPDGELWLVHSSVSDSRETIHTLKARGFDVSIVAQQIEAYGPLMRERKTALSEAGVTRPGVDVEILHVFRARIS